MNVRQATVRFLFSALLLLPFPSWAAEQPADDTMGSAPKSYIGEATEAVVGRVFGVEGDASNIKYHVFELTQHSPASAATRSLAVPGWGQHFNNQKAKGTIFFFTTVAAVVGSAQLYNRSIHSYNRYKAQGVKDSSLYDDYKNERTAAIALGGVAAVLWAVGIADAYRHAYNPLYSKSTSIDVAFNGNGGRFTLNKNF